MKRYGLIALALAFVVTLAAQPGPMMEQRKDSRREMMARSTMAVENTAKGVVITVSTDDPEMVKVIQDYWAGRASNWGRGPGKLPGEAGKKREKGLEKKATH